MCIYPWHDAAPRYLLMLVSPVADYLLITIIIIVTALATVTPMRVSKSQESNIDPNSHAQPAPEF